MPRRIQCRPGRRLPAGVVVITCGSRWQNPFRMGTTTPAGSPVGGGIAVRDHAHSVALFRTLVDTTPDFRAAIRTQLAGKDVACACAYYDRSGEEIPCHGDHLLEVANPDPYQRCYECGAIYATATELLRRFNDDCPSETPALTDPAVVRHCPGCLHDFTFPPRVREAASDRAVDHPAAHTVRIPIDPVPENAAGCLPVGAPANRATRTSGAVATTHLAAPPDQTEEM